MIERLGQYLFKKKCSLNFDARRLKKYRRHSHYASYPTTEHHSGPKQNKIYITCTVENHSRTFEKKKVQFFFSTFALKFKICLNLIKIHMFHLEHVCIQS